MTRAGERIIQGLKDAIAFAQGDTSKARLHTPEEIIARKKARHKQRAGLKIVYDKTGGEG